MLRGLVNPTGSGFPFRPGKGGVTGCWGGSTRRRRRRFKFRLFLISERVASLSAWKSDSWGGRAPNPPPPFILNLQSLKQMETKFEGMKTNYSFACFAAGSVWAQTPPPLPVPGSMEAHRGQKRGGGFQKPSHANSYSSFRLDTRRFAWRNPTAESRHLWCDGRNICAHHDNLCGVAEQRGDREAGARGRILKEKSPAGKWG